VRLEITQIVRRIDAGGGPFTDPDGATWAADQPWTPGSSGYAYADSDVLVSGRPIAGTTASRLFETSRQGAGEYRFGGLPAGNYEVLVRFAEPSNRNQGTRVFDVTAEGATVLAGHDTTADAGNRTADEHRFTVSVTDGELDVGFVRQHGGAKPIVAAIAVTQLPG
jgi:hypothetical protein